MEWISTDEALAAVLERAADGPIALDCEADSLHHYPEKVCLIQLTHGGRDVLIDPLAGIDVGRLADALDDPRRRKILHGADYDLRVLHRDFGLTFCGLFDTMVAARLAGEPGLGLAALLSAHLGVVLDKRFQRADWSLRPLTGEMEAYAALDTRHLEELCAILEEKLREKGRLDWAAEEFELLEGVRWREPDEAEAFRRVKGSGKLPPGQQLVLRELWRLREATAREKDRPPFKILPDAVLLEVARRTPRRARDVERLRALPPRWRRGARAAEIVDAVERGLAAPPAGLPEAPPRGARRKPPEPALKALLAARDTLAAELGVEPAVLGPRRVIEALHGRFAAGEDPLETPELRRWQASLLLPLLERV